MINIFLEFRNETALDGIRPTITPSDPDVSYLPTENHTFTCESTEPITWHLPIVRRTLLHLILAPSAFCV